jgi:hypothetical protein
MCVVCVCVRGVCMYAVFPHVCFLILIDQNQGGRIRIEHELDLDSTRRKLFQLNSWTQRNYYRFAHSPCTQQNLRTGPLICVRMCVCVCVCVLYVCVRVLIGNISDH